MEYKRRIFVCYFTHKFVVSEVASFYQKKKYFKMKMSIVFVAVLAVALAAPIDDSKNAQILRYENDNIGVDGYNFA